MFDDVKLYYSSLDLLEKFHVPNIFRPPLNQSVGECLNFSASISTLQYSVGPFIRKLKWIMEMIQRVLHKTSFIVRYFDTHRAKSGCRK